MNSAETSVLLLTLKQAAERLSISKSTLQRQIAAGVLHAVKIGRASRISASELEAYVQKLTARDS